MQQVQESIIKVVESKSSPEYNAYIIDNNLHLEVAVPGIRRENLSVELVGNLLTVKGVLKPSLVQYSVQHIRNNVELTLELEGSYIVDVGRLRIENGILFIDLVNSEYR